jgi:F0F1-type ATP synthase delta subunit
MKMAKVFIAHASENKDVAQDIFYSLSRNGLDVYLDEKSLETGEQYHTRLKQLILDSDYFVFLISSYSVSDNSYCLTELKYAEEKWAKNQRGFVPVMLENVETDLLPGIIRQSTFLTPKGNVTAEVVSEILSQEQGSSISELEVTRKERVEFATRYFQTDLNNRNQWFHEMAMLQKKRQLRANLGLALASSLILFMQIFPVMSEVFETYRQSITALIAIYPLIYVIALSHDPWKWRIYSTQAENMESEYRRYVTMVSPYTLGIGELRARELFVENVEQVVNKE